jgi:aromatic ring-cleaving dioxygenase
MPKTKRTRSPGRSGKAGKRRRRAVAIENFHAHVYYDADTRKRAEGLCKAAGKKFGVKVGRMHDNPVGPHPRGSCQLTVGNDQLAEVIPWLILNRNQLTVFAHAQTGNALKDHTEHVLWLGPSEELKLSALL